MFVAVRPFERRDRDQLTSLVNLHVAAVIPGVVLSVNAVLSQLEHEPYENIVDAGVAERRCLVAVRGEDLVAGALLHRFRANRVSPRAVAELRRNTKAGLPPGRATGCVGDPAESGVCRLIDAALENSLGRGRAALCGAGAAMSG